MTSQARCAASRTQRSSEWVRASTAERTPGRARVASARIASSNSSGATPRPSANRQRLPVPRPTPPRSPDVRLHDLQRIDNDYRDGVLLLDRLSLVVLCGPELQLALYLDVSDGAGRTGHGVGVA